LIFFGGAQVSLEARLEDERKTAMEVREKCSSFFWRPLKGAWHEIFDFRFSSWISFLEPLGPVWDPWRYSKFKCFLVSIALAIDEKMFETESFSHN
jgi:hypothetical protein